MIAKIKVAREKKNVLIASHRGCSGGNVIQNTIPAFENALLQGADILEMDVIRSTDGKYFLFHTDQEPALLGTSQRLNTLDSGQILSFSLHNCIHYPTRQKVNRLDDILEQFKGRCLINIDRSWGFFEELIPHLDRFQMQDQIILKGHSSPKETEVMQSIGSKYMYMPIVSRQEDVDRAFPLNCRVIGMEMVFQEENSSLLQEANIRKAHDRGWILWANSINLDDTQKLGGGHDDRISMFQDPDDGWGWLVRHGFDVIQTDWPMLLSCYLRK
jgi:glycerophosphoryl diester phosphodiesterase